MRTTDSEIAFRELFAERGLALETLTAESAVAAMTDFYLVQRASDTEPLEQWGDMLLFQWGTYRVHPDLGDGSSFQYDITRQFIIEGHEETDDALWQLSLTLHYVSDDRNAGIEAGNQWCDHPSQVGTLLQFIESVEATAYARAAVPDRVHLWLEEVG